MARRVRLIKSPNIQGQINKLRQRGSQALGEIGEAHAQRRRDYVSEWTGMADAPTWTGGKTNNQPTFPVSVEPTNRGFRLVVGLEGERAESTTHDKLVYELLRDGTAVRKVSMTVDFRRKTSPQSARSGPGAGGRLRFSLKEPHEGIDGRNQDEIMNKELETLVEEKIGAAYGQKR
jgi:hypothetical protein